MKLSLWRTYLIVRDCILNFNAIPLFAGEFNLFPLGAINCPYPEAKGEDDEALKVSQKVFQNS